ncbi:hypothetical protein V9T40_014468 [Parthenolecanium corni]|uniref:PPM-type phosphatase domain-containing protein n=1 Tax=Parthenolecanium corni TaxID=536013 RepID=A0AAN9T3X7_9HEMI
MDGEVIKYQKFFEHFLSSVNSADQLPVKIIVPTTTKAEVKGTVIDWILQYLYSWSCPRSLISPLAKVILDEVKPSLDTTVCPFYNEQQGVFTPIPLMQYVIGKIREICQRFVDGKLQYPQPVSDQPNYLSIFATKNRRRCMEDCHVIISDLNVLFDVKTPNRANYYAIFDGHNGSGAALYSSAHLHQFLVESQFYPMYPDQALNDAFKMTDRHLLEKEDTQFKRSGTTAVCVLWHQDENMLYTAWVGDSEAILAKKGKIYKLVEPHRAAREDERQRISDLKGVVLFWGASWRVNGQLAISRAIGDSEHKPHVSSTPDIVSLQLDGDEDFVILACDGLWDSVTYEKAAQAVYNHVQSDPDIRVSSVKKVGRNWNPNLRLLISPSAAQANLYRSGTSGSFWHRPIHKWHKWAILTNLHYVGSVLYTSGTNGSF